MPQVEIISEREAGGGWTFEAQVLGEDGRLRKAVITLSWADYNLWSPGGADRPEDVAEAVVLFLVRKLGGNELPGRFDASLARRRFPDADAQIGMMIRDRR